MLELRQLRRVIEDALVLISRQVEEATAQNPADYGGADDAQDYAGAAGLDVVDRDQRRSAPTAEKDDLRARV